MDWWDRYSLCRNSWDKDPLTPLPSEAFRKRCKYETRGNLRAAHMIVVLDDIKYARGVLLRKFAGYGSTRHSARTSTVRCVGFGQWSTVILEQRKGWNKLFNWGCWRCFSGAIEMWLLTYSGGDWEGPFKGFTVVRALCCACICGYIHGDTYKHHWLPASKQ